MNRRVGQYSWVVNIFFSSWGRKVFGSKLGITSINIKQLIPQIRWEFVSKGYLQTVVPHK